MATKPLPKAIELGSENQLEIIGGNFDYQGIDQGGCMTVGSLQLSKGFRVVSDEALAFALQQAREESARDTVLLFKGLLELQVSQGLSSMSEAAAGHAVIQLLGSRSKANKSSDEQWKLTAKALAEYALSKGYAPRSGKKP